jgi:hypothetical protein
MLVQVNSISSMSSYTEGLKSCRGHTHLKTPVVFWNGDRWAEVKEFWLRHTPNPEEVGPSICGLKHPLPTSIEDKRFLVLQNRRLGSELKRDV